MRPDPRHKEPLMDPVLLAFALPLLVIAWWSMNFMKFRVQYGKVWIFGMIVEIFSGGAKLLYASIFFMQLMKHYLNFAEINCNLILKLKVSPKTTGYIPVFSFSCPV